MPLTVHDITSTIVHESTYPAGFTSSRYQTKEFIKWNTYAGFSCSSEHGGLQKGQVNTSREWRISTTRTACSTKTRPCCTESSNQWKDCNEEASVHLRRSRCLQSSVWGDLLLSRWEANEVMRYVLIPLALIYALGFLYSPYEIIVQTYQKRRWKKKSAWRPPTPPRSPVEEPRVYLRVHAGFLHLLHLSMKCLCFTI